MNDKVVGLPTPDKNELREALEGMKRQREEMSEYIVLTAKMRMESFIALQAEGFTDEQALELCKNPHQ